jgi:hypoxanthine-DNA glycosylase
VSNRVFHPFSPFVRSDSVFLILGSFPSLSSIKNGFYYGHKQNQFWKLLSSVFFVEEPLTINQKKEFLIFYKIALWDIIKSCKRDTSLDASLKDIEVNDLEFFLKKYPNIKKIFFTSRFVESIFKKNFSFLSCKTCYLPSPSPVHRKISFEQKVTIWRQKIIY